MCYIAIHLTVSHIVALYQPRNESKEALKLVSNIRMLYKLNVIEKNMERVISDLYSAGGRGILNLYRITDYTDSVYLLFPSDSPGNLRDITSISFHILSNSLCNIVPLPFDTVQSQITGNFLRGTTNRQIKTSVCWIQI